MMLEAPFALLFAPAAILIGQTRQGSHGCYLLARRQHDCFLVVTAGAHGHGVIGAETLDAHFIQQQPGNIFQIIHIMPIHSHPDRYRKRRLLEQT